MTRQEVEQFLSHHNLSLIDEPMEGDTDCYYRITCPLDQQILVLTWSQDGSVQAQCLNDCCQINRHEDNSFAFLQSLVQVDITERDAVVPTGRHTRDAVVPDERDAPVPEDEHDSASLVPGAHSVSASPVPAPEMAPRDASVPAKDQVITDLLRHFLSRATEQQKDELLTFLRHGSNSEGIQPFIDDCFVRSFGSRVEEQDVYRQYKAWCIKNGHYLHTKTDLYQFLEHQGYRRKKSNGKKYFIGLTLRDAGVPSVS